MSGTPQEVQWVGRARVCPQRGSLLALTCCPAFPCSRGQGSGRLWAGLRGSLLSPNPPARGGTAPHSREAVGSSLARQHQPGATRVGAGEGRGLPWKG